MNKLYYCTFVAVSLILSILFTHDIFAIPSTDIVISQIKAGNKSNSRFIEIYNNSSNDIEITDWCFYYSSPSDTTPYTELGCFNTISADAHRFLKTHSFALIAPTSVGDSNIIIDTEQGLGNGTSGHVYLMNSLGNEVDKVGWGTASNAEANSPKILGTTKVIERKKDEILKVYIDTDNNANDFVNLSILELRDSSAYKKENLNYLYNSIYEVTDMCSDIPGIQEDFIGDSADIDSGICLQPEIDLCLNIDGIQNSILPDYRLDENGDCIEDVCKNTLEFEMTLPPNKKLDAFGNCIDILLPLQITELLPNAVGNDEANEFIEIYNPNLVDVELSNYIFFIGLDNSHSYNFPSGSHIGANQYLSFSNKDINFTLLNTTSSVRIKAIDEELFFETLAYINPDEGMAWALIDEVWQYTNRPTSGLSNLPSLINNDIEDEVGNVLVPCAANQYRNPVTNRCRLISTSEPSLVPCKDGQYRSEETNRCRSIISDIANLVPCAEGQERNPATNRCRSLNSVLGVNDLTPCKEGQERNPETNRCRNIVSMPTADYAPEKSSENSNNNALWLVLAGIGLLVISYGVWEWRKEFTKLFKKLKQFHTKK